MRCFVTGATGYIGRHLVRNLMESGHEVRALVRSRTRSGPNPLDELTGLGVEVIEGDLLDQTLIGEAIADTRAVFHLAWQTNRPTLPTISGGTGEDQWRANVGGTQILIRAAKAADVRHFIFTSTVAIYGNVRGRAPVREEDALETVNGIRAGGMADYIAPKIAAEKMLAEQLPKPDYIILRLSIVYGPHAPGTLETVRYAMVGRAPRAVQPVQRVHVNDVVKSLMLAISRPEAANKTMNIAGNETVGSDDYIEALRHIATWIQQGKPRAGHRASFALQPMRYDMTRARKYLGFHSSVPLIDGLEEMVEAALPSIAVTDTPAKRQPQQARLPTASAGNARFAGWGPRQPPRGQAERWGMRRGFGDGFEP